MKIDEESETHYVSAFKRTMFSKYNQDGDGLSVVDLKTLERKSYVKTGLGPCSVSIYEPSLETINNTYEVSSTIRVYVDSLKREDTPVLYFKEIIK
ncbi:hypothetical protein [Staphylococcus felis]|uniref:hypothetical protein n=1 Tax=Staphylococcus felis TaxID=46127 RepID=UPI0021D2FDF4|nr:hypothetical protein [Staphylococcus felis]UXR86858.1 hypothetical protein MUA17_00615 [Staphylococcus felis]